jgi:hypothetical protein
MEAPKRSFSDVRRLSNLGNNLSLTLPKEVSDLLKAAGIEAVRVSLTEEGILLTPYREPEIPAWAKEGTE